MADDSPARSPSWKWMVCGLLLLATMLNYMDRQTLAQTSTEITTEYRLSNEQYGNLELGFGLAFAIGSIVSGFLADRWNVRLLYPAVLVGWSLAGLATAYATHLGEWIQAVVAGRIAPLQDWLNIDADTHPAYFGLLCCRTVLGFFEAGQWPCAMIVSQRILARHERTLGNSLLQSGASLGAILTPLVVQALVSSEPGSWRGPFVVIGAAGLAWLVPWLWLVRERDLARRRDPTNAADHEGAAIAAQHSEDSTPNTAGAIRRFLLLALTVTTINMNWQFLRAWLPKFLSETHGYTLTERNFISMAYYIAADVGCLCSGAISRTLSSFGWGVHAARMAPFTMCVGLIGLSTFAATAPRGVWLLAALWAIGFGALGVFPTFYSLSQELSHRRQGIIIGSLSATTWVTVSIMQKLVGRHIDEYHSYADGIFWIGLTPAAACVALWLFWDRRPPTSGASV